jgi:hypothetical protein
MLVNRFDPRNPQARGAALTYSAFSGTSLRPAPRGKGNL